MLFDNLLDEGFVERHKADYSFHLEITDDPAGKDYLTFQLDYGEGVTGGALSLEGILDSFRDTVKGVMRNDTSVH